MEKLKERYFGGLKVIKDYADAGVAGVRNWNKGNKISSRYASDLPSALPGYDIKSSNQKIKELRKKKDFGGTRKFVKKELEDTATYLEKKGDEASIQSAAYYRDKIKKRYEN